MGVLALRFVLLVAGFAVAGLAAATGSELADYRLRQLQVWRPLLSPVPHFCANAPLARLTCGSSRIASPRSAQNDAVTNAVLSSRLVLLRLGAIAPVRFDAGCGGRRRPARSPPGASRQFS